MKKETATIEKSKRKAVLTGDIFDTPVNLNLLHMVAVAQMSNRRKKIAKAKNKSEVRGGGKKPWRQKGTGRARHGSIRSPLWIGGGVTFGPTTEREFKKTLPKNVKRKALLMALSQKQKDDCLLIVDEFDFKEAKTKEANKFLSKVLPEKQSCLVVLNDLDKNIILAMRNIPKISTIQAKDLNCLDVLLHKYLLIDKKGLEEIKKTYGN